MIVCLSFTSAADCLRGKDPELPKHSRGCPNGGFAHRSTLCLELLHWHTNPHLGYVLHPWTLYIFRTSARTYEPPSGPYENKTTYTHHNQLQLPRCLPSVKQVRHPAKPNHCCLEHIPIVPRRPLGLLLPPRAFALFLTSSTRPHSL